MTTVLPTGFDAFLYASIGNDASGAPMTLLTALARLDVDAWEEAADLARLPLEAATQRLATHLEALPNGPDPAESAAIATRLVTLLHRSPAPQVHSPAAPPLGAVAAPSRRVNPAVYYLVVLICMLAWQWAAALHRPQILPNTATPPGVVSPLER